MTITRTSSTHPWMQRFAPPMRKGLQRSTRTAFMAHTSGALRWASDRLGDNGIVAFVTNGSFFDGDAADGIRKRLTDEFSHLYIFNLRGNQRTSGEESRREDGRIFGSGSRTPVTISIIVTDPRHTGACELNYHDIGDYLSREEKLAVIKQFASIKNMEWQSIKPNDAGDLINQRDPAFDRFIVIGDKSKSAEKAVFDIYSSGLKTNRDSWAYNICKETLASNMSQMIEAFNDDSTAYRLLCENKPKKDHPKITDVINLDPKCISWTDNLKMDAIRGKQFQFDEASVTNSLYRPYTKQWVYFNRNFNERVYQSPCANIVVASPEFKNLNRGRPVSDQWPAIQKSSKSPSFRR